MNPSKLFVEHRLLAGESSFEQGQPAGSLSDVEQFDATQLLNDAIQTAKMHHRIPGATYRLQLHSDFTLRDALKIVPYLHRLGITHLYLSSILTARPGSRHGYDVMDHGHLNPELGTEDDLGALVRELRQREMGLILDIVPNHMWVGEGNKWWMDVLENGLSSRFASYFDIAWQNHPHQRLKGQVLLPILDEPYGKALQAGRFRPFYDQGQFGLAIDQHRLPLDPRTYSAFLEPALITLRAELGEEAADVLELQSILAAVRHLAPRDESDPQLVSEALAEIMVIKRRLRELADQSSAVRRSLDDAVLQLTETPDHPAEFSHLIELLDAQPYRPCFWRVALDEINYRRFFEVNDLAALAEERREVFQAIHVKPFEWLRKGLIDGLRVDHVDGLLNPKEYLKQLQQGFLLGCAEELWHANPLKYGGDHWNHVETKCQEQLQTFEIPGDARIYVVVEKILGPHESLPADWVCHGTTGYEFLNELNGLFVDLRAAHRMTQLYQRFTGQFQTFDQIAYDKKLEILRSTMASELHVLSHRLDRLAQMEWWSQDFTLNGLRQALEQMIACFPVYRSYVCDEPSVSDRIAILRAARRARATSSYLGPEIFAFICDTLLLKDHPTATPSEEYRECRLQFVGKFQQLTSPVMAKGVEDTAHYIFNRLVSLNEVGGEPAQFGRAPRDVHEFLKNRPMEARFGLSALSTHDTKRSEDVRARINVLSQMPHEWEQCVDRWRRFNDKFKIEVEEGLTAPDGNEEYLLYQTLVGVRATERSGTNFDKTFIDRVQAYMLKAIREAKVHSSWIHPETKYDEAVSTFVASILDEERSADFLADLKDFQSRVDPIAKQNSLSQTLIRCLAPGIPDTYQGTELWDDSLVDPDNRRPVDYRVRMEMLEQIEQLERQSQSARHEIVRRIFESPTSKLFVTVQALRLRRANVELFRMGEYIPLETSGPDAFHIFGFLIARPNDAVLVAVPRLVHLASATAIDGQELKLQANVDIPQDWVGAKWRNVLTGETCQFKDDVVPQTTLFGRLPLALLRSTRL